MIYAIIIAVLTVMKKSEGHYEWIQEFRARFEIEKSLN